MALKDVSNIQRDLALCQRDIKTTLAAYKVAEGEEKLQKVEELKGLNANLKQLNKELETAIESLHVGSNLDTSQIGAKALRVGESKLAKKLQIEVKAKPAKK